jgi:hypothetical protein
MLTEVAVNQTSGEEPCSSEGICQVSHTPSVARPALSFKARFIYPQSTRFILCSYKQKRFIIHIQISYTGAGYSIRNGDWLQVTRQRTRRSSPSRVNNFLQIVQTGSWSHTASYPMSTGSSFSGGKEAGT